MALARVQAIAKVKANAVASVAITFATLPTLGNGVIVLCSYKHSTSTVTSVVDNRGHTYTLAKEAILNSAARVAIYACPVLTVSAAPFTITLAFGASTGSLIATALEISGVGTGLVVDQTSSGSGTTGTAVATATTPALTATEVVQVAAMSCNTNQTSIVVGAASPTWTEEYEDLAGSISNAAGEADSRIVTGALGTTPSATWTQSTSTAWNAALVAFKAGASAAVATATPYVWGPL